MAAIAHSDYVASSRIARLIDDDEDAMSIVYASRIKVSSMRSAFASMTERAVCDAIRHAGKMDPEVVNQAIRSYVADPAKSIGTLMEYSRLLRIQRKAESLVGVWL